MQKFQEIFRNLKILKKEELKKAIHSFSGQKWLIFMSFLILAVASLFVILNRINRSFMVETPGIGGSVTEGIIGTPRFINPVLAISDADKDLTALVYSGLMRKDSQGELINDLAESYDISKDKLTYTFKLKDKIYFQDKKPVTADDVIFTINKIKDPSIKSPKKLNWEGVTATKIDNKTVQFTLKQPFNSFLENTAVGILPYHLWKDVAADQFSFVDLNIKGIGSGPYKINQVNKDSSGIPQSYELISFNKFILGEPFIKDLIIKMYGDEDSLLKALENGSVEQASAITAEQAAALKAKNFNIQTTVLPRIFGLFFNQNQSVVFTDKSVINAFELAIDKEKIVDSVFKGYGISIDSPIPQNIIQDDNQHTTDKDQAKQILNQAGWKAGSDGTLEKTIPAVGKKGKKQTIRLEFSISTGDSPELRAVADLIKSDLESLGAKVELKVFGLGDLNQNIIRPRKYEALLFGQIVNQEGDLFAFWHSSQRNDPGLNVAMYTNAKVDKILEDAADTLSKDDRLKKYAQFNDEIKKDKPAIFLYSPSFIYVVAKNLGGFEMNRVTNPADRWSEVYKWYKETEKVWKIFIR